MNSNKSILKWKKVLTMLLYINENKREKTKNKKIFSDTERKVADGTTVPRRRPVPGQLRVLAAALPLGRERHVR